MQTVKLVCAPSTSADVVSYDLIWGEESKNFVASEVPVDDNGNLEFMLNDLVPALEGTYSFSIVAIDGAGNRSEASVIDDVVVDFLAPAAPGPISVVIS